VDLDNNSVQKVLTTGENSTVPLCRNSFNHDCDSTDVRAQQQQQQQQHQTKLVFH